MTEEEAAHDQDVPDLDELCADQCSVLHRDQLRQALVTRSHLRWQVHTGRWTSIGPVVVALQSGPLSLEQQQWAAVLTGGDGAMLGGRSALSVNGLHGFEEEVIHVLVPHGRRWPALADVPVHWHVTRRLTSADRHPGSGVARTRVDRSVIDGATWSLRSRAACGLLAAAVQQRLTTASRLLDALGKAGPIRHRALMTKVLRDVEGGAGALSEVDFGRLCRDHDLPSPLRQVVRQDDSGRRRYVDAELVSDEGVRVCVEVDGAAHMAAAQWWQDTDRANELVIAGDRTLRFPSFVLYTQPERVADQIRRALQRR